jgi:hypothetical protein
VEGYPIPTKLPVDELIRQFSTRRVFPDALLIQFDIGTTWQLATTTAKVNWAGSPTPSVPRFDDGVCACDSKTCCAATSVSFIAGFDR